MQDERISFEPEQFEELYQKLGSSSFKMQSEVMEEFSKNGLQLFYKLLGNVYRIITIIGVIAGFGFTALPSVQVLPLFLIGQGFLFIAIITGLFWTQRTYLRNIENLDNSVERIQNLFNARNTHFIKMYDDYFAHGSIKREDFKTLTDLDTDIRINFPSKKEEKKESTPIPLLIMFLIIGSFSILGSFINPLTPTKAKDGAPQKTINLPSNTPKDTFIAESKLPVSEAPIIKVQTESDGAWRILITAMLTAIGGIVVYVFGQLISKFIIDPMHEQKKVIGEIADALIYYANIYTNPLIDFGDKGKEATDKLRQLATQLQSKTQAIPKYSFLEKRGWVIPTSSIYEASSRLIGLSNSVGTGNRLSGSLDTYKYAQIVRSHLKIYDPENPQGQTIN